MLKESEYTKYEDQLFINETVNNKKTHEVGSWADPI